MNSAEVLVLCIIGAAGVAIGFAGRREAEADDYRRASHRQLMRELRQRDRN